MSELLEVFMLLCFGVSWPISIRKSIVSRTAKGKSLVFECFIFAGYLCGIASKLISQNISYVVIFYRKNLVTASIDIMLYLRNRRWMRKASAINGSVSRARCCACRDKADKLKRGRTRRGASPAFLQSLPAVRRTGSLQG